MNILQKIRSGIDNPLALKKGEPFGKQEMQCRRNIYQQRELILFLHLLKIVN